MKSDAAKSFAVFNRSAVALFGMAAPSGNMFAITLKQRVGSLTASRREG
jgi:hypothetical protein